MWWKYAIIRWPFWAVGKLPKYNLQIEGWRNVPRHGPFIVVSNHQSSIDIVALSIALKRGLYHTHMWPWAKAEIEKGKEGFLGKMLWKVFGVIPVYRDIEDPKEAFKKNKEVIDKSLEYLKIGNAICVFGEGTRYPNKELGEFEYGVANIAKIAPLVPIIPVAVWKGEDGFHVKIGESFTLPKSTGFIEILQKSRTKIVEKYKGEISQKISEYILKLENQMESISSTRKEAGRQRILLDAIYKTIEYLPAEEIEDLYRLATKADRDYIRDRVFELLPPGWKKVDKRRKNK